jgi:hypothetical protein
LLLRQALLELLREGALGRQLLLLLLLLLLQLLLLLLLLLLRRVVLPACERFLPNLLVLVRRV